MATEDITRRQDGRPSFSGWRHHVLSIGLFAALLLVLAVAGAFRLNRARVADDAGSGLRGITTPAPEGPGGRASDRPTPSPTPLVLRRDELLDNDPALGDLQAPVLVVEFLDVFCPYCARWHEEVFPYVREQAESGNVLFVARDLPLMAIHPKAGLYAASAECVRATLGDEAYWPYITHLMQQRDVIQDRPPLEVIEEVFEDLSEQNRDELLRCLGEGRFVDEVVQDWEFARNLNFWGTPSFVVAGHGRAVAFTGALRLPSFQTMLEGVLRGDFSWLEEPPFDSMRFLEVHTYLE